MLEITTPPNSDLPMAVFETVNNLFLPVRWPYTFEITFIKRCGIAWCCPTNINIMDAWQGGCFIGCRRLSSLMENDYVSYFVVPPLGF